MDSQKEPANKLYRAAQLYAPSGGRVKGFVSAPTARGRHFGPPAPRLTSSETLRMASTTSSG